MNIYEFVNKYEGKSVDFDGAFGCQCVDLFRQYNKEVRGYPHTGAVEGAVDIWDKWDYLPVQREYYKRVPYVGGCVPNCGDVVIFRGSASNKWGHVGISLYASAGTICLFEQDGFNQARGAHISLWTYERVLGWLYGAR